MIIDIKVCFYRLDTLLVTQDNRAQDNRTTIFRQQTK